MIPWLTKVLHSFRYAMAGILWALRTQRNLQIHLAASIGVLILGLVKGLAAWQWCAVALAAGTVWTAELVNTALEVLCDRITKEQDDHIRRVKDMGAGAVLVAAIAAAVVGVIVFF